MSNTEHSNNMLLSLGDGVFLTFASGLVFMIHLVTRGGDDSYPYFCLF